jgi:hypothetical protein
MHESAEGATDRDALAARRNFFEAVCWFVLGAVILVASWKMDRLQSQDINPYTIPGLLPGLLGIAMMLAAGLIAIRSVRERAFTVQAPASMHASASSSVEPSSSRVQLVITLVLSVAFVAGLLGRGLPFWLAGALFVAALIAALQYVQCKASAQPFGLRQIAVAIVVGLGAGGGITLLFQTLFLVRLP